MHKAMGKKNDMSEALARERPYETMSLGKLLENTDLGGKKQMFIFYDSRVGTHREYLD